jgi:tRNA A-37 threonylcarbamoyl transferase component Bud32
MTDVPPTILDETERPRPDPTVLDEPAAATTDPPRFPAELAAQYELVRALDQQGAEAELFVVRDSAGAELLLKHYRARALPPDEITEREEITPALMRLDRRYAVPLLRHGTTAEGRRWELYEYLGGDTLAELVGRTGPMAQDQAAGLVRQLCEAVLHLHRHQVLHRDIKPANIVLPRPGQPVLIDYGISRLLDVTVLVDTPKRTPKYAAPEAIFGYFRRQSDWWSVAIIALELVTGRHPYAGRSDPAVMKAYNEGKVPLDGLTDPRLRWLCRGLLVRYPDDRWDDDQVREWLDGGSPKVVEAPPIRDVYPLYIGKVACTEREQAAEAIVKNWDLFCAAYLDPSEPLARAGGGLPPLCDWLAQFGPAESRVVLVRTVLAAPGDPHRKASRLLWWLDRDRPPYHRGERLLPADLRRVAARCARPEADPASAAIVRDLWQDEELLFKLADFRGAADLRRINPEWRDRIRRWQNTMPPPRHRADPTERAAPTVEDLAMLLLSTMDAQAARELDDQSRRRAIRLAIPAITRAAAVIALVTAAVALARLAVPGPAGIGWILLAGFGSVALVAGIEGALANFTGWEYPQWSLLLHLSEARDRLVQRVTLVRGWLGRHRRISVAVAGVGLPAALMLVGLFLVAVVTLAPWLPPLAIGGSHAIGTIIFLLRHWEAGPPEGETR